MVRERTEAARADKHDLYQKAVQNPDAEVPFFNRVFKRKYGRRPTFLREDFCGTAFLSAVWVDSYRDNTALGVDLHGPTLKWGMKHNLAPLGKDADRVTLVQENVLNVSEPRCDVLAATNFSWWGFKTREELRSYFRNSHASLRDEGVLVLDTYGGPEAQVPQFEEQEQDGFEYIWDQDTFNPITNEVRNRIHFRFDDGSVMKNAFRYDWRLWSLPETTDILKQSGFSDVVVYWEGSTKFGEPTGIYRPSLKGDLAPSWVAYIVAFR